MEFILSFMIISYLFIIMAIWIFKRMFITYKEGKAIKYKPIVKKKNQKMKETLKG